MKAIRCIIAALLLLVFGGGVALATPQGSEMMQSAAQTSVDQHAPTDCNKCNKGDMAIAAMTCSFLATCMSGVLPPASERFTPVGEAISYSNADEALSGFQGSPEPFPPRSDILA